MYTHGYISFFKLSYSQTLGFIDVWNLEGSTTPIFSTQCPDPVSSVNLASQLLVCSSNNQLRVEHMQSEKRVTIDMEYKVSKKILLQIRSMHFGFEICFLK